jgi:hypothetical protein
MLVQVIDVAIINDVPNHPQASNRGSTRWLLGYLMVLYRSSKANVVGGWPGLGKKTRWRPAGGVTVPWQEYATGSSWWGGRRDGEEQVGAAGVTGMSARWWAARWWEARWGGAVVGRTAMGGGAVVGGRLGAAR